MSVEIRLINSDLCVVVSDEYAWLAVYSWRLNDWWYAEASVPIQGETSRMMHRIIMAHELEKQGKKLQRHPIEIVHHKDHNRLNNQTENLEVVSQSVNSIYKGKHADNSTGEKYIYREGDLLRVDRQLYGTNITLGLVPNLEAAISLREQTEALYAEDQRFVWENVPLLDDKTSSTPDKARQREVTALGKQVRDVIAQKRIVSPALKAFGKVLVVHMNFGGDSARYVIRPTMISVSTKKNEQEIQQLILENRQLVLDALHVGFQ